MSRVRWTERAWAWSALVVGAVWTVMLLYGVYAAFQWLEEAVARCQP